MLTFLSVALMIYGSMHCYALSKVWFAFPHLSALRWALVLWGITMTFSPLLLWQLTRMNWHNATVFASWVVYLWMALLFLFCSVYLVFDLGHAVIALLGAKWPLRQAGQLPAVTLIAFVLLGYGFFEARHIRVEKIKIATRKLSPAIGSVTIAQISDLHLGVMLGDEFLDRVIATLRELKPDIVVSTGDMVDGQGDGLAELARRFLAYRAPKGSYAIIGNHEVYAGLDSSIRFLNSAGFAVLRGESADAGGIVLSGIDDPSAGKEAGRPDSRKSLALTGRGNFIVLLKHQPVVDKEIPFDLQLSGHIHGGQIFPFGLLTRLFYHVNTGLTRLADGRLLYVSRGTGTWGPPIRIFAEPEITLFTIGSEENK
jgi:uncharacterized protein